jgi:hypothetical protein
MKNNLLVIGAVLGVVLFLFAFTTTTRKSNPTDHKVIICHIPPGNPDNRHEIEVSTNAVDAHLAHGDTLGECTSCGCD